jgi:hypothetical protein
MQNSNKNREQEEGANTINISFNVRNDMKIVVGERLGIFKF